MTGFEEFDRDHKSLRTMLFASEISTDGLFVKKDERKDGINDDKEASVEAPGECRPHDGHQGLVDLRHTIEEAVVGWPDEGDRHSQTYDFTQDRKNGVGVGGLQGPFFGHQEAEATHYDKSEKNDADDDENRIKTKTFIKCCEGIGGKNRLRLSGLSKGIESGLFGIALKEVGGNAD